MGRRTEEIRGRARLFADRFVEHERSVQASIAAMVIAISLLLIAVPRTEQRLPDSGRTAFDDSSEPRVAEGVEAAEREKKRSRSPSDAGVAIDQVLGTRSSSKTSSRSSRSAPGVTDKEILIGASYDKAFGALAAAYGYTGAIQFDAKSVIERLVKYINEGGGVGGRRLRVVWYVMDQTSGKSPELVAQEMCTTWTQDTRVFAVLDGNVDILQECLTKAGIVQVWPGVGLSDSRTFKRFPYFIELETPALDRLARFVVDELAQQGYYKRGREGPGYKLGVASYDDPVFDRTIATFRRALKAKGLVLSEVGQIRQARAVQEIGDEAAAIRAMVLRFKSRGVTHVQFFATATCLQPTTFMQFADQQQYYPRYGLTSNDCTQFHADTLANTNGEGAARRVLSDAVGVGWALPNDVPRSDFVGREPEALRSCRKITSTDQSEDSEEALPLWLCDSYFYFKAVVEKGGPVVNASTWLEGVATVGRLPSAYTFVTRTRADRHDGMSAIRHVRFFDDCACFHYVSGLKPV